MTAISSLLSLRPLTRIGTALTGLAAICLLVGATVTTAGAQALPVDHFRVYPNVSGFGIDGPIVQIVDQFGTGTSDQDCPSRLMVPIYKNDEVLWHYFSHLTC